MKGECFICRTIEDIERGKNPYFVLELDTGYIVLGHHQFYRGYTLFLCKKHVFELHELEKGFRERFLAEMSLVAEAVFRAFRPKKLNYELLGNSQPHLHWHIFPRYQNDSNPRKPVWCTDEGIRYSEGTKPSENELNELREKLLNELVRLVKKKSATSP